MKTARNQFKAEIRHFHLISLLNLVFAALAIAFGVQYIVSAVLGQSADPSTTGLRMLSGALALSCFGLSIGWILSTARVFEGVEKIKDDLDAEGDGITDDRITCLIVRMLAHYRDNRRTIGTMIRVCTLGGVCFFVLGIANGLKALSVLSGSISFTLDSYLLIPAMLLSLGIAISSLLSSYYFLKFARVWDRRLHEIEESECTLKKTLGLNGV
jgi:hypothetical protein